MLRKILKWTGVVVGVLIGVVVVAAVVVWIAGGRVLARQWEIPPATITIPDDSASVEEGRRLAATRGCTGCHDADLSGDMLFDDPMIAKVWSPNLTKSLQQYSDEQLVTIIRHGIWPDGTSSPAMPSSMYYNLSDEDVAAIIAFLRAVPPVENDLPPTSIRLMGRFGLATGKFNVQADLIDHGASRIPPTDNQGHPNGSYLAYTTCTECHGHEFEGGFGGQAPPLVIVKGYSVEEFARLMETGVPRDGRDLNVMDDVALSRFANFSGAEIEALHGYLQSLEPPTADSE